MRTRPIGKLVYCIVVAALLTCVAVLLARAGGGGMVIAPSEWWAVNPPVSTWTDTNNPAAIWYLDDAQPVGTILDSSSNAFTITAMSDQAYYVPKYTAGGGYLMGYGSDHYFLSGTNVGVAWGAADSNSTYAAWSRDITPLAAGARGFGGLATFANNVGVFSSADVSSTFYSHADNDAVNFVTTAFTSTSWVHKIVSNDGIAQRLYIDGILVATRGQVTGPMNATTYKLGIGIHYNNSFTWNGSFQKVMFYKRTLSSNECFTMATTARAALAVDTVSNAGLLVACMMTNDVLRVRDSSGNNRPMCVSPSVGNTATFGVDAGISDVADFDGTDDAISDVAAINDTGIIPGTNDHSWAVWVNPDTLPQFSNVLGAGQVGTAPFSAIQLNYGVPSFRVQVGTTNKAAASAVALATNAWSLIVGTRDYGVTNLIYVNAVIKGGAVDLLNPQTTFVQISHATFPFDGKMYRAAYYDHALSQAEVTDLYNHTSPATGHEVKLEP